MREKRKTRKTRKKHCFYNFVRLRYQKERKKERKKDRSSEQRATRDVDGHLWKGQVEMGRSEGSERNVLTEKDSRTDG